MTVSKSHILRNEFSLLPFYPITVKVMRVKSVAFLYAKKNYNVRNKI